MKTCNFMGTGCQPFRRDLGMDIKNEYMFNSKFRQYVDKYCAAHGISVGEALTHALVRQVCRQYTEV